MLQVGIETCLKFCQADDIPLSQRQNSTITRESMQSVYSTVPADYAPFNCVQIIFIRWEYLISYCRVSYLYSQKIISFLKNIIANYWCEKEIQGGTMKLSS